MTAAIALPEAPAAPVQLFPAAVDLHFEAQAPSLEEKLRQTLPPTIMRALEAIWQQNNAQVFEPLLYAPSQDLVRVFSSLYPTYWRHNVSAGLLLNVAIGDLNRMYSLTIRGLDEAASTLDGRGRGWLGDDAATAALMAVHTVRRIAKATVSPRRKPESEISNDRWDEWRNSIVPYSMMLSAVVFATNTELHTPNGPILAYWARGFAARVRPDEDSRCSVPSITGG